MALELENQRRYDYLKYRQKLNEIMELKDNEEKEKFLLLNQIAKFLNLVLRKDWDLVIVLHSEDSAEIGMLIFCPFFKIIIL